MMVAMDRQDDFMAAVEAYCVRTSIPQDHVTKMKARMLLKPVKPKTEFMSLVSQVVSNLKVLSLFIERNKSDYLSAAGAFGDVDKDRVEAEVRSFVQITTKQVDKLKDSVQAAQQAPKTSAARINAQTAAHLHGIVLTLAEQLQRVTAYFDRLRQMRYRQKLKMERKSTSTSQTSRKTQAPTTISSSLDTSLMRLQPPVYASQQEPQQQLHLIDDQTTRVVEQLVHTTQDVHKIERSLHEVAVLNQMFSTAVLHQTEQIETIYQAALEATDNIIAGNEQITKTIQINRSSNRYLIVLLLTASLSLLFYDWFNS